MPAAGATGASATDLARFDDGCRCRPDLRRRAARAVGCRHGVAGGDAQRPVVDFEVRIGVAADAGEPRLPRRRVGDPPGVAEGVEARALAVGGRHPAQHHHADLGAEPGGEPERVAHGVHPADGEVELAEVGVGLLEVRHRRDDARLQRLDGDDVLDADAHRVAGEPLGVGHDDLIGRGAEDPAQGVHLGGGAPAAGRRVGLVGDEHRGRCHLLAPGAARLGLGDDRLHDVADVVDVEAGAVEGAVGGDRAEHLADRPDAALAGRGRRSRRRSPPRPCRGSSRGAGGRTARRPPRRPRPWRRRPTRGSRRPSSRAGGRT